MTPSLEARQLTIEVHDGRSSFTPVEDLDVAVAPGRALGIVGESGSGKSLTLRALMGLLPPKVTVRSGEIRVNGEVIPRSTSRRPSATPGAAMIFQEPLGALNPLLRVEHLLGDVLRANGRSSQKAREERALSLLQEVGITDPPAAMRAYPHQISGGQRQRVMIAMALASEPRVLLCDEPTTALDVTVQQRILRLLRRIRQERDMSLVYVTHDLAVVNEICDDVAIIYAGQIVESGPADGRVRLARSSLHADADRLGARHHGEIERLGRHRGRGSQPSILPSRVPFPSPLLHGRAIVQ